MSTATTTRPRAARSATPGIRTAARRVRFWIGFALIALAFVALALVIRGSATTAAGTPLGADDPAPQGAQALVRVLERHGVRVTATDTLARTRRAAAAHPDATVFVYDPDGNLPAGKAAGLARLGAATVLMRPSLGMLDRLAPDIRSAGRAAHRTRLPADCDDATARRAGTITAPGQAYRVSGAARGCFPSGHDAFATASTVRDGHRIDVLGSTALLDNEHIAADGNAALAIGTLGAHPHLVWYLPSALDRPAAGTPSLAELTPGWVSPVVALAMLTALAAIAWRGRRLGPLVVEDLPVTVRARETMEGRARLYQRADARLHALDSLRIGATGRLADRLALGPHAGVGEVADAAAALTGRPREEVRGVLVEAVPADDRELMRLSDALARLEDAVAERTGPDRRDTPPHEDTGE